MSASSPRPSASLDAVVADVAEHGFGLLSGVLDPDRTRAMRQALVQVAAAEREAGTDASYHGRANQRVYALVGKHPLFLEAAADPRVLELVERVIGPDPLLSNISANIAGPGGRMQAVHADQGFLPPPWPEPWSVQVIWPLDRFDDGRGATRIVPGSHRAGRRPARAVPFADTIAVEAPPDTLAVIDGRCWHGTGKFTDDVVDLDDRRHALLAFYCKPFLRAQENWGLSTDPSVWQDRPDVARLLGILSWEFLGLVDGRDADISPAEPAPAGPPR